MPQPANVPPAPDLAAHHGRFEAMLDAAFRRYGEPGGLPDALRAAARATPRHRFVHRFRLGDPPGPGPSGAAPGAALDLDADPALLGTVYSDQVMRHVDAAGVALPSSNSQPSYVLWLLHLLGLAPGQRVLEVGSGSGWLAAVMGHLVGPAGRVTGVELIPALAEQGRADLDAHGPSNVGVITGDGTRGHPAGAPYDRVVVTAALWDLPPALLDQLVEGGRMLVPVELRGGDGCQVCVLRRESRRLVAERAVAGWFVPLLGPGQARDAARRDLRALPFVTDPEVPALRVSLPLGTLPGGGGGGVASALRAFLGRTEPGFAMFGERDADEVRPWERAAPFGLLDMAGGSAAAWVEGEVRGYGTPVAAGRLLQACADWVALGLPGMGAFGLEVVPAAEAPAEGEGLWVEPRGEAALLWRLPPGSDAWREALARRRRTAGGLAWR